MKHPLTVLLVSALALTAQAFAATASPATLTNLNAAFRGESNASQRYTAFSQKADSEGFTQVAKLFRAAAAAEAIHRDTHKATILDLGGTVAPFALDVATPGSTAENLKAAIKGETYERDTMYPEFLKLAKSESNRSAERSFHFALAVEKEHAALYAEALAQLGKNAAADYYVCPVCGNTTAGLSADDKCPTCRKPTANFIKTS